MFVVFVRLQSLAQFLALLQSLAIVFSMKAWLVYCTDVGGIMQELEYSHRREE